MNSLHCTITIHAVLYLMFDCIRVHSTATSQLSSTAQYITISSSLFHLMSSSLHNHNSYYYIPFNVSHFIALNQIHFRLDLFHIIFYLKFGVIFTQFNNIIECTPFNVSSSFHHKLLVSSLLLHNHNS